MLPLNIPNGYKADTRLAKLRHDARLRCCVPTVDILALVTGKKRPRVQLITLHRRMSPGRKQTLERRCSGSSEHLITRSFRGPSVLVR